MKWHPTPVLLPGKSHGQRSLVGCSPWGRWESDPTERLHFHFSLACIGEGNGNPLQCSCLENPRDGGVSWAAIYGVAQSLTRLKRLSSSSSSSITWKKANCIAMKIFWVYFSPSFIRLTYTRMNSQKVLQEECGGAVAKVDLGFRQHDLNTFP